MWSLSTVNQYLHITRHVSSVVVYWTHMHGVRGSSSGQAKTFFHAAAMLSFYIIQRITIPKSYIFQKSITIHHCMTLLQVALVLIPPHKFVCLPFWHY
jgi:hypothetical protein